MNNCGNCKYWERTKNNRILKACEQASGTVNECRNHKFDELMKKYGFPLAYPMVWIDKIDDCENLLTDGNFVCPYYQNVKD